MPKNSKTLLQQAAIFANVGNFSEMLSLCDSLLETCANELSVLLDTGALLQGFGFISQAGQCFEQARLISGNDLRPQINLANIARDAGDHAESRRLYAFLLQQLPNSPVIRRNLLISNEYDPAVTDIEHRQQAGAWGEWAVAQSGGWRPRPAIAPRGQRKLRVGYVSADLCQHTVGLFLKDVLAAHDTRRISLFAYSAGVVNDWVTDAIRKVCTYREVAKTSDQELVKLIKQDEIDILIDLSGHTAGSRLTAFAYRPAPVMVSWLGYFASTGLPCLDAVLLDEWHAPEGMDAQFIEPIIRLPQGRFCYQPVPWAPAEVSALPVSRKGYITFGCFNNTAKLNEAVFDLWAKILHAVPDSRLILKWRSFNDEAYRQKVAFFFVHRSIPAERIELRGPSFHADLLNEYADIDIALDPFPFTGGLTSCESLWMGVPVVTLPQSRVVSRQTFALLSAIGLPELAAKDIDDYVRIAYELAMDHDKLTGLRQSLRSRMQASPLMDVKGFTRQLESTLCQLHDDIYEKAQQAAMNAKTVLHVGPGHRSNGAKLPVAFQSAEWREIRLDIDPANDPDIVGSMLDMAAVASESVDAIYSAHNIEHVHAHEVPVVLAEFLRVLKPTGFAVITCPDLQAVCQLVAEDKLGDAAYQSPAGPITPLDIIYGHGQALAHGHMYMAHKCGFTLKTLTSALHNAGFKTSAGKRRTRGLDLWVVAGKGEMTEAALRELAGQCLPN